MGQNEGALSDEIDGFHYRVFMLDPLIAADIIADIGHVIAPVLGALGGMLASGKGDVLATLMEGGDAEDGEPVVNSEAAIEKAVLGFFDRFSKGKQRELIGIMMKMTMIVNPDGTEPPLSKGFTNHFRGRISAMYQWFWFALKTQFGDFTFGQGVGMSAALAQMAAKAQS